MSRNYNSHCEAYKKGKYAVSAMLDIASFEDKKDPSKIQDISKRQRIPNSYLEQILRNLRREGLLISVTGPNGGYRLLERAKK